ncbi:MAG: hypothetical protein K5853_03600 [Lachnospiraceae bacterium]|nr:hypothetical protein [Lachnospiraceae bacterium]
MKNALILLKTLLLSTSRRNIIKYSTDKKKKKRARGGQVGVAVIFVMIMAYSIVACVGYGRYGMAASIPALCAVLLSGLAFFFTFFSTNGYLFNFKEYDMLMSLPIEDSMVAACKFMYMYIKSLPWYLSISLSMLIGYAIFAHPGILICVLWVILSLILPIIPMLAASFLGFLVARVSAGFKKTNIIQTVLTMVFVILCFFSRFFVEALFENGKAQATLTNASEATERFTGVYLPAGWFAEAVTKGSISSTLLLTGVTILLFALVFRFVGRSYRNINSALKNHAAAKSYKMSAVKKKSLLWTIAYKEFKRLTGSTPYMVNGAMGEILALVLGVATLVVGFDRIVAMVTDNAPFDPGILTPAIPFIIYFFIGMMATTTCSPSLEGKNYWILQSMPIEKKTIWQGKMLFNLCLTVPVSVVSTLCMCISAKVSPVDTLLFVILGIALCFFSTTWGCVCGVKHMRLDWENEVEVIKQGAGVTIYLLPNMFVVMGLTVLVVILGMKVSVELMTLLFILIASVLAAVSYLWVLSLAKSENAPKKMK